MSEERHYSAEHGYDDAISVAGDGDCKLASFSRPQNSQEEEWFAYGSDEDEDAIANLAVYMRDELRNCIVETDRVKAINKELLDQLTGMHLLQAKGYELANESIRLKTSNSDLLEALKTCCIATQGKKKAFCECFQHDTRPCLDMEGVCRFGESGNCHIWKSIQKVKGMSNE